MLQGGRVRRLQQAARARRTGGPRRPAGEPRLKLHLTHEGGGTGLRFSARTEQDLQFCLDSGPGAEDPSPIQSLLASAAACCGMDVISILMKKRQPVASYSIEIEGDRRAEHPRSFTRISLVHRFRGDDLSLVAIEEAIRLSEEKYCSVIATLRMCVEVQSRFEVQPAEGVE